MDSLIQASDTRSLPWRRWLARAGLAALYFATAKLGLSLAYVHPSASAVWPPSGIALVAMLLAGGWIWPGIFLGALAANLYNNLAHGIASVPLSLAVALGIAAGNTCEAAVGRYLLNRFAHGRWFLDDATDFLKFIGLAVGCAPVVSATLGILSLSVAGLAPWGHFWNIWQTWWLGDAVGILVVTPFIVAWSRPSALPRNWARWAEAFFLSALFLWINRLVFGEWGSYHLAFLCLPILIWIAFRFRLYGATLAILALSGLAAWSTVKGSGPFSFAEPNRSLILLQLFIATMALSILTLALLVKERMEAEKILQESNDQLGFRVKKRTEELTQMVWRLQEEIEQRRHAETALQGLEEKSRLLIEGVREYAIYMLDPQGCVVSWNEGAQRLKGYRADEILGRHFSLFYNDEDQAAGKPEATLRAATTQGRAETEGWRLRKDGSRFWANVLITALYDAAGAIKGFAKLTRDITERKAAEEKMLLKEKELKDYITRLQETQRELQKAHDELETRVQERTSALTMINAELVVEATRRKRAEAVLAKQTQELLRSNAELEQFAYITSHDLQEPLRMVASYAQLLERRYKERLDHEAKDYIQYMVEGAIRMKELITNLLDYSRLNAKDKVFAWVDCGEALDMALKNLQFQIRDKNAVVTHGPLPQVMGDFTQLGELFQNLVGNGLKFNHSPQPEVRVSAEQRGEEHVFAVQDNGIGIKPEYRDRIFVIFQRLHNKEQYGGTGIGLTICKKIVERHGGRIWVESQPEQGSTFFFTLPSAAGQMQPK